MGTKNPGLAVSRQEIKMRRSKASARRLVHQRFSATRTLTLELAAYAPGARRRETPPCVPRASNPQPPALQTSALPPELGTRVDGTRCSDSSCRTLAMYTNTFVSRSVDLEIGFTARRSASADTGNRTPTTILARSHAAITSHPLSTHEIKAKKVTCPGFEPCPPLGQNGVLPLH